MTLMTLNDLIASYLCRLNLSPSNLIARGFHPTTSLSELESYYVTRITQTFSDIEMKNLKKLDNRLKSLIATKWPFAAHITYDYYKTLDNLENGFPHTHGSSIFLPQRMLSNNSLTLKTMVHEFIHVFQREYPIKTHELLTHWGYEPICYMSQYLNVRRIRLNPDVNNLIYKDSNNNIEFMEYNNAEPTSLTDVYNVRIQNATYNKKEIRRERPSSRHEHPFEYMAYTLSEILVGEKEIPDDFLRQWLI